jgi:hypothetical protein
MAEGAGAVFMLSAQRGLVGDVSICRGAIYA